MGQDAWNGLFQYLLPSLNSCCVVRHSPLSFQTRHTRARKKADIRVKPRSKKTVEKTQKKNQNLEQNILNAGIIAELSVKKRDGYIRPLGGVTEAVKRKLNICRECE